MVLHSFGQDSMGDLPEMRFNEDGTITNSRPSRFMQDARQDVRRYGQKGQIGWIVENSHGQRWPMSFIRFHRMKDLIERGMLKVVEPWKSYNVPEEYGLAGYDTEFMNTLGVAPGIGS